MPNFNLEQAIAQKQISEPQRSYLWRVVMPSLSRVTDTSPRNRLVNQTQANLQGSFGFSSEDVANIDHRVTNVDAPFIEIETDKVISGNTYWYTVKHNDIGSLTMQIEEYEDGLTTQYIQSWLNLIKPNGFGYYNPPAAFKYDIDLYKLSTMKNDIIRYRYRNFFISGVSEMSHDYESNESFKYNLQFTGDSLEVSVMDAANLEQSNDELDELAKELRFDLNYGRPVNGAYINNAVDRFVGDLIGDI